MFGTQKFRNILAQEVVRAGATHTAVQMVVEQKVYSIRIWKLEPILSKWLAFMNSLRNGT